MLCSTVFTVHQQDLGASVAVSLRADSRVWHAWPRSAITSPPATKVWRAFSANTPAGIHLNSTSRRRRHRPLRRPTPGSASTDKCSAPRSSPTPRRRVTAHFLTGTIGQLEGRIRPTILGDQLTVAPGREHDFVNTRLFAGAKEVADRRRLRQAAWA